MILRQPVLLYQVLEVGRQVAAQIVRQVHEEKGFAPGGLMFFHAKRATIHAHGVGVRSRIYKLQERAKLADVATFYFYRNGQILMGLHQIDFGLCTAFFPYPKMWHILAMLMERYNFLGDELGQQNTPVRVA